jgi:exodeoxyribonuclease V alpha subunit
MSRSDGTAAVQTIAGNIKHLTFYNPETGFFVASVVRAGSDTTFTAVGNAGGLTPGLDVEVTGDWERNKYGTQFKVSSIKVSHPVSREGLVKFLASGPLPGVGEVLAQRLVDAFGEKVLEVIASEPERLVEVPKLGKKKAKAIADAWAGHADLRQDAGVLVFLRQHGLSANRAAKVCEFYKARGTSAMEALRANPYDLTRLWGIGFSRADAFALSLGVAADSPFRMRAAITHIVQSVQDNGSCGVPQVDAVRQGVELTGQHESLLESAVAEEIAAGLLYRDVVGGKECLFHAGVYKAENEIARLLAEILRTPPLRRVADPSSSLSAAEAALGLTWDKTQADAVVAALENKVFVVSGGPGTGKTTVTRALIRALSDAGLAVAHCAPTGKAADRAKAATGFPSQTVHRLLEVNRSGEFTRNAKNPLECEALIVDEPSMVDVWLFLSILRALPPGARLYLMGDADQLPSVGPGRVLQDLLRSGVIPGTRLTKIFRQAATSKIIRAAHLVNSGSAPAPGWEKGSDFGFIDPAPTKWPRTPEEKTAFRETVLGELLRHVAESWMHDLDPLRDVQVLAPTKMGILGTENLNNQLRELLNPDGAEFTVGKKTFRLGDKVIQTSNCYEKEVFNGEIGYLVSVDEESDAVVVAMPGRNVAYPLDDLRQLDLAYAITVHKSQGSEFPAVFMVLDWSHFMMLKRNLVFTGITRAKNLMLMFGSISACRKAAGTPENDERYSRLANLLPQAVPAKLASEVVWPTNSAAYGLPELSGAIAGSRQSLVAMQGVSLQKRPHDHA